MSCYMLVADHATTQRRTKRSASDIASRSGKSGNSSGSSISGRTSISCRTSIAGSVQSSSKKIFDPATMRYVSRESIINLDSRIQKYESEFKALVNQNRYHHINERMNRHYYNSSKVLFTVENINILRYTYFENISDDFDFIRREISRTTSTGDFCLNYLNKLRNAQGKHNMLNSLHSNNKSTQSFRINEKMPINSLDEVSIALQFRSKQFWNNVYQDIKSIAQDDNDVNFFDLLPPINHCLDFFSEYFDFALYNLMLLEGDGSDLNSADKKVLLKYTFYYYDDEHIEKFKSLKEYLIENYDRQRDLGEVFNKSRGNCPKNKHIVNSDDYTELNRILTEVIIDNLQTSLHTPPNNSKDELFSIWKGFLKYHLIELMMKESYEHHDHMQDKILDDSFSDLNNYVISRTSSTIKKNRNFTHSSNSSRKLSGSSGVYPPSPQSPLSEIHSACSSNKGVSSIDSSHNDTIYSSSKKSKKKLIFSKFIKRSDKV